jgi:hypothetical protein
MRADIGSRRGRRDHRNDTMLRRGPEERSTRQTLVAGSAGPQARAKGTHGKRAAEGGNVRGTDL